MFWISPFEDGEVDGSSEFSVDGGNGSKEEDFNPPPGSPPSPAIATIDGVARAELARRPTYRACGCSQWVGSGPPAVPTGAEVPLESLSIQSLGRVSAESRAEQNFQRLR